MRADDVNLEKKIFKRGLVGQLSRNRTMYLSRTTRSRSNRHRAEKHGLEIPEAGRGGHGNFYDVLRGRFTLPTPRVVGNQRSAAMRSTRRNQRECQVIFHDAVKANQCDECTPPSSEGSTIGLPLTCAQSLWQTYVHVPVGIRVRSSERESGGGVESTPTTGLRTAARISPYW